MYPALRWLFYPYKHKLTEAARKEGVHLFVLPRHSNYVLQPLNVCLQGIYEEPEQLIS